jgi:hypothetical protein
VADGGLDRVRGVRLVELQRIDADARVDDGARQAEVLLDRPSLGLYMPPLTWGAQFDHSEDAVLMVLTSDPYDAADYIEDYDEFTALAAAAD